MMNLQELKERIATCDVERFVIEILDAPKSSEFKFNTHVFVIFRDYDGRQVYEKITHEASIAYEFSHVLHAHNLLKMMWYEVGVDIRELLVEVVCYDWHEEQQQFNKIQKRE